MQKCFLLVEVVFPVALKIVLIANSVNEPWFHVFHIEKSITNSLSFAFCIQTQKQSSESFYHVECLTEYCFMHDANYREKKTRWNRKQQLAQIKQNKSNITQP